MPGAISYGFHEGSRSEILADYLFSSWGTVTPVRYPDDHGIDLYCTMTERLDRRAIVTEYYSVQIKSKDSPWVFENPEAVRWLTEYPTPLFLAHVDKKAGQLAVFQTLRRFEARFVAAPERLEFAHGGHGKGEFETWDGMNSFPSDPPILVVDLADLMDAAKLAEFRSILTRWIAMDRHNCDLQRMRVLRFRRPQTYVTNHMPSPNTVEIGELTNLSDAAVLTAIEVADCVGHQLEHAGDRRGATCAAVLVRYLLDRCSDEVLTLDGRWPTRTSPLQFDLDQKLATATGQPSSYVFEAIDKVLNRVAP